MPVLNYKRAKLPLMCAGCKIRLCNSRIVDCFWKIANRKLRNNFFLTIKYFFHSKLSYLLCLLVDQARKEITQISSLIFHRTAKNLFQTKISLVTLSKNFTTNEPSQELKPRSLLWESGALLIQYSVPESGRPMKALFNFLLITSFAFPISQQFTQDKDIEYRIW